MAFSEKEVLHALSHVDDPDLRKDIVSLGMVKDIVIGEGTLKFKVELTTPACPMKDMIENACRNAIAHFIPEKPKTEIEMTSRVTSGRSERQTLPGVKNVIAIASGKGGVGKSTVAANLARALASSGAKVGLLDADIYGPSIPTLFGIYDEAPGSVERGGKNIILPIEKEGIKLLSIGFMVKPEDAVAWRGPMISSALRQLVNDTEWGDLDYLIFDLPPGTGDIQITLSQLAPVTGAIIVTTPQKISTADARRAISMFRMNGVNIPVIGLVENMAWFETPELPGKKFHLFGEGGGKALAEETQTAFLGSLPLAMSVVNESDTGKAGSETMKLFGEIASAIAQQISIQNSQKTA